MSILDTARKAYQRQKAQRNGHTRAVTPVPLVERAACAPFPQGPQIVPETNTLYEINEIDEKSQKHREIHDVPPELVYEKSPPPYQLVTDASGLQTVYQAVDDSSAVGLDLETTGLSPRKNRVRLIQLATDRGTFVIDLFRLGGQNLSAPQPLWDLLAEPRLIVHNAAFDLAFLWHLGLRPSKVTDLMILSRLLTAGTRDGNAVADLAERELGKPLDKTLQAASWSGALSPAMLDYAARDAETTRALYAPLATKIKAAKLERVASIESRAVPAFLWLAMSGAPFDAEGWTILAAEAEEHERCLIERLDAASPARDGCLSGAGAWNWRSPDEVAAAFAVLGFHMDSTDDAALAGVVHLLAAILREYRSTSQLVKTFGRSYLDFADEDRIYPRWVQLGTDAGRSSCKEPNLQQIPKDIRYRRCFRAPEGRVLIKCDYSQLQLRLAAKIAGDKKMIEAFRSGADLHTLTAQTITGKKDVTKAERRTAKAVNFGLLFGLGAKGLMGTALADYGIHLDLAEATAYREAFFQAYTGLREWHRQAGRSAAKESRTILGRRRLFTEKTPFTHRLNSPVQGSEADGAKLAMVLLWERREQCPGAFPVLFVHDEIVVEADADKADDAAAWLKQAMIDGMKDRLDPVPCEVEAQIAQTWGG
jgi:DNA polymerase-1